MERIYRFLQHFGWVKCRALIQYGLPYLAACHVTFFTKVPLRQVMSLCGHLLNASRACKCNSYLFEWVNIKIFKTGHQAYDSISYLKSPIKTDNINVVYFVQLVLKKGYFMLMEMKKKNKMYTEKSMSLTAQHLLSNKELYIIS